MISVHNFEHSGIPYLDILARCDHIVLVEPDTDDTCSGEQLDGRPTTTRCPPFNCALRCSECNHCILRVLLDHSIGLFGWMFGYDSSSRNIVIDKLP